MKFDYAAINKRLTQSRSPCGERGLKLDEEQAVELLRCVAPRAGSVD